MPQLPPIAPPADDLESDPTDPGADQGDEDTSDLDPQFAADAGKAFPDLDDSQLASLQRAVLGLLGR